MKSSIPTCELLSALADGELGSEEVTVALRSCERDEAAFASWSAYHLIGDALRSPVPATRSADLAFLDRLNQRLAQEQAPAAQGKELAGQTGKAGRAGQPASELLQHRGPAANDGNIRWKLVAGFASVAAVAAIAWNASGMLASGNAPQLTQGASSQQQVLVASPQGPMVRDARLEELLAAHRQLGSASALQLPSGFLRNATFEPAQSAGR